MKIMHILPQLLNTKGGPSKYVARLAAVGQKLGHNVVICCPGNDEKSKNIGLSYATQLILILKYIFVEQPDIVHIHGRSKYIIPALIAKLVCKSKLVYQFHTQIVKRDYLDKTYHKRNFIGLRGLVDILLINRCDKVLTVASSIIDKINSQSNYKIKNYYVVYSGADSSSSCCVNQAVDGAKSTTYISSIGVMAWDWKVAGHILAVRAIAKLVSAGHNGIHLIIFGDGALRGYIENEIQALGVQNHVTLRGNVDNVMFELSKTQIYLHTGLNEGVPLSIIEAWSIKLPVIAVNAGGIPEVAVNGKNCALVEIDSDAIADGILRLMQNSEYARTIAMNGHDDFELHYTWESVFSKIMSAYVC